jgi:hypothetical protein
MMENMLFLPSAKTEVNGSRPLAPICLNLMLKPPRQSLKYWGESKRLFTAFTWYFSFRNYLAFVFLQNLAHP